MQTRAVWDTVIFLLNGFIFILIGLQLPGILKRLQGYTLSSLLLYGMAISVATILVRILWVFASAYTADFFKKGEHRRAKKSTPVTHNNFWKNVLVVSWTGTRGMVSMATALALPLTLANEQPFTQRHLIIFLCFVVIFITLVVQGLSLPLLIRLLKITKTENSDQEEKKLQLQIVTETIHFIAHDYSPDLNNATRDKLIKKYTDEAGRLTREIALHDSIPENDEQALIKITALQQGLVDIKQFQRELLLQFRKSGQFSDSSIRVVEEGMDIDELNFNQTLPVSRET